MPSALESDGGRWACTPLLRHVVSGTSLGLSEARVPHLGNRWMVLSEATLGIRKKLGGKVPRGVWSDRVYSREPPCSRDDLNCHDVELPVLSRFKYLTPMSWGLSSLPLQMEKPSFREAKRLLWLTE